MRFQNVVMILFENLSQAEIRNFDVIVAGNEDISGCQVSVHNIFAAQVGHALKWRISTLKFWNLQK